MYPTEHVKRGRVVPRRCSLNSIAARSAVLEDINQQSAKHADKTIPTVSIHLPGCALITVRRLVSCH